MNPQDEDAMYGLCDLGTGYPEIGYVRLSELQRVTVRVPPSGTVSIARSRSVG